MGYINAAQLTGMKTLHDFANMNLFDPHKDLVRLLEEGRPPSLHASSARVRQVAAGPEGQR